MYHSPDKVGESKLISEIRQAEERKQVLERIEKYK